MLDWWPGGHLKPITICGHRAPAATLCYTFLYRGHLFSVSGVLGPCAGVTTRSVRGRIVVLAADKHTKDRPISP